MRPILLMVLAACSNDAPQVPEIVDDGSQMRIAEGTVEAFGVIGLLNDRSTTQALLDDTVGLDVRAARSLTEHRNGPDAVFGTRDDNTFDSIAEVDDQYYVGDSALEDLLAYAVAEGWVPGPSDIVGSWETVSFTAVQAAAVLELVNGASQVVLDDDVGLDRRAAANIVDVRPISDIGQLAAVPYVGRSALRALQDYADLLSLGQSGDDCQTSADCADDLRCMGAIAYGEGIQCVDTWGVFSWAGPANIPDDGTELITSVDVQGLATVPVDVVLTIDIDHERPSDLVLTIDNFNGYGTSLWTGGDDNPQLEMVVYAFPSDDAVHGLYNVRLTDTVPGAQGVVRGWDLLIVSTYD
jgi:hypothetical protein